MSFPLSSFTPRTVQSTWPNTDSYEVSLSSVKNNLHQQILEISKVDPTKASELSHYISCCQWTADDVAKLQSLGLTIDNEFQPLRLLGGAFEPKVAFPRFFHLITNALREGKFFSTAFGKKEVMEKDKLKCILKSDFNGKADKQNNEQKDGEGIEGTYHGQMSKNLVQGSANRVYWTPYGQGKIVLPNGDRYEGRWQDGLFWNQGSYETADGSFRYEGYWESGQPGGYGKLFESFSSGKRILRYEGQWGDGLFDGNGTYYGDNGTAYVGKWQAGKLIEPTHSQEELEELVRDSADPVKDEEILSIFKSLVVDEVIFGNTLRTVGLERNSWMAESMKVIGLLDKEPLSLLSPPTFQVLSHDTKKLLPLMRGMKVKDIDIGAVTLPAILTKEFGHQNALEWLKSFAVRFEKIKTNEASIIASLTKLKVKRLILGVGVPIDTSKGYRGEFSPSLVRANKETWGYIAWTNNGVQSAIGAEHGPAGSSFKIMTEEVEDGKDIRKGWAIKSIDVNHMKGLQAATMPNTKEESLDNKIHLIAFRFIEEPIPQSYRQSDPMDGMAPEVATMVVGEHKERDERGTYKAKVYRRLDTNSTMMVTLITSPINVRREKMTENQLKLSIYSHHSVLKELVENALANSSI